MYWVPAIQVKHCVEPAYRSSLLPGSFLLYPVPPNHSTQRIPSWQLPQPSQSVICYQSAAPTPALTNELINESLGHLLIHQLLTLYSQDASLRSRCKGVIVVQFIAQDFYVLARPQDADLTEIACTEPSLTIQYLLGRVLAEGHVHLIFQLVVQWLPAGELVINCPPQLPIRGFRPGRLDYIYLAAMGYKHDTFAVLLACHALHRQPARGMNLVAPILGLSRVLVANRIRLRPAINREEVIYLLHLPAPHEQALHHYPEPDAPAIPVSDHEQIAADIKARAADDEQQAARQTAESETMHDANPWLRMTRWARYLAGVHFQDMLDVVATPDPEQVDPVSQATQRVWDAMAQLARRSQRTVQHCGNGIRMAAASTMPNQTPYQPLRAYMDEKSIQEHVRPWQQILLFIIRTQTD
ncbi:hypothetical protein BDV10DRAFT_190140, partial [Aspergillus recurvatus]